MKCSAWFGPRAPGLLLAALWGLPRSTNWLVIKAVGRRGGGGGGGEGERGEHQAVN